MIAPDLSQVIGFNWDAANVFKIKKRHHVEPGECEEAFHNEPLLLLYDEIHSTPEERYIALGVTNEYRHLHIVFTIRNNFIRVISARNMTKHEEKNYENVKKNS